MRPAPMITKTEANMMPVALPSVPELPGMASCMKMKNSPAPRKGRPKRTRKRAAPLDGWVMFNRKIVSGDGVQGRQQMILKAHLNHRTGRGIRACEVRRETKRD